MKNRSRRVAPKLTVLRTAHFELFEDRLLLSANPLGDFSIGALEQLEPELGYGEIAPTLADVHEWTGVDYVREQYGFEGDGQTVVVIDTGIAYDHYALGGGFGSEYRVVGGWDFSEENDADPYDDGPAGYHGTHVAGIIASDNDVYAGVAPGVDLVSLRVFNDWGAGYFSWVESALQWVHDNQDAFEDPITTVNLSLGADLNSDSPPWWATLEDEFEQLAGDGIFVTVAAGNAFTTYGVPGLSYPASSPFVVPVASVGNDGQLSGFSQRNDRVLAAPGETITSTVPDHIFGADGVPNDWGTVSGTSMAAPYVAGASVLVREAMEFVGYVNAMPDTIYDHLYDTADVVYDAATGANYHRINLYAAIDALMPADDYGPDAGAAHALGTIVDASSVSGLIGHLGDVDCFIFTAGHTGVAHLTVDTTHELLVAYSLLDGEGQLDGGRFSFDVTAGETYNVSLAAADGIGYYDLTFELEATVVDWGTVEFEQVQDQNLTASETWRQFTASRAGLLTVEAFFDHTGGNVDLEIYDSDNHLLAQSDSADDYERLDVSAAVGESFYLRSVGANSDVDFRLTNLVAVGGDVVEAYGTSGDDTFVLNAADFALTVNGVAYSASVLGDASVLTISAGEGADELTLRCTDANEQVTLRMGRTDVSGPGYEILASSVEAVHVDGGGGNDVVSLYDSAGDDAFWAEGNSASLWGEGFRNDVRDFEQIFAYATHGGHDVAELYDSAGRDTFTATSHSASLKGPGFSNYAQQFEQVHAHASHGGYDVAYLYDSAGNDTFTATSYSASLSGPGFSNHVQQFERVCAYSTRGGEDVARLYDSAGNDTFRASSYSASLGGRGYYNYAQRFERVYAYATQGGEDVARLYDSAGSDTFWASSYGAALSGQGFYNYAQRFERVYAYATRGGEDVARLYDSSGNDTFWASSSSACLSGPGFSNYVQQFDRVYAYSTRGGQDVARLYDSAGNDTFWASSFSACLSGPGFSNRVQQFETVSAYSTRGGEDVARLYDSAGNDTFWASSVTASLTGRGFSNRAQQFARVYAYATRGGQDIARLHDFIGNGAFLASGHGASLSGPAFYVSAQKFDQVYAHTTRRDEHGTRLQNLAGEGTTRANIHDASSSGSVFSIDAQQSTPVYGSSAGGADQAVFRQFERGSLAYGRATHAALAPSAFRWRTDEYETVSALAQRPATARPDLSEVDGFFERLGQFG